MGGGTFALTVVCLALGQSPSDLVFSNQRSTTMNANIPESRRAEIRELLLFASQDQGETWGQVAKIAPTQSEFVFNAPVDGAYWLRLALINREGKQEPASLYKVAPNWKLVVDTLKPLVRITSANRSGNEIAVAWEVREDHPEWSTFRLEYQAAPGSVGAGTPINAAPGLTGQARFTPSTNGAIVVRLTLKDKAGNETIVTSDVVGLDGTTVAAAPAVTLPTAPAGLPALPSTITAPPLPEMASLPPALTQASLPPANTNLPTVPSLPAIPAAPELAQGTAIPGNPGAKMFPSSEKPKTLTSALPAAPPAPPVPLAPASGNRWSPVSTANYQAPITERPIASTEFPQQNIQPVQYQVPAAAGPRKPQPTLQYVNSPEVLLEYELSKIGPSGIGSVDIHLTQDEGQSWDHVASDTAVVGKTTGGRYQGIVELPGDGIYGFILAVKSQAQLKQDMQNLDKKGKGPKSGDVAEIRVEVDTMPPTAELFPPRRDTGKVNSLMLVWTASDKNLGSNPITLEWAERREGPWFPIANNIPNAGKHSWQLPDRLPVQVYMRLRVRDLAGNEGVAVTPDPQLVDLSEPEGRLVNVTVPPRRPQ